MQKHSPTEVSYVRRTNKYSIIFFDAESNVDKTIYHGGVLNLNTMTVMTNYREQNVADYIF